MACLLKRNNGVYYSVECRRGKRLWTSLRTTDEARAKEAFEKLRVQSIPYERATLESFARMFLNQVLLNFRPKTVQLYRQSLNNFLRITGDRSLSRVTPLAIEKFKSGRVLEVSPVTVNIELKTLRAAFAEAVRLKLISENPFEGTKRVLVPEKEAAFLTKPELLRLVARIDDIGIRNIVLFAFFTMMRRGELTHLRWSQVDLERKIIHIRSSGEFRVKGGRYRWTPMSDWVYNYLRNAPRTSEFVFTGPNGLPYDGGYLSHRFKRYVTKAGLPRTIHFHSLRHSGVSWLINRGVPAPFVQKIAGHSSLAVTGIYTHLEDANLTSAIQAFDSFSRN